MLAVHQTRLGVRIAEVFFAESAEANVVEADVIHFIQARHAPRNAQAFDTIVVGISDLDTALMGMRKQARYDIRRAERQGQLECSLTMSPSQTEVDAFVSSFQAFAKAKGISPANVGRLTALRATRNLALSQVASDGKIISRHAYITHESHVRLLHSCTGVPTDYSSLDRATLGQANRYLHWFDMCSLNSNSFDSYDLGGVSSGNDPRLAGIDAFKASFGGERRREYNLTTSRTVRGSLALFLSNRARDGR